MPALGHELAHVVQQDRLFPNSGDSCVLQRSGLEKPNDTQGRRTAAGLSASDCDTCVAHVLQLGAIHCPQRPECRFAQVHDQKNKNLMGIFRSDHQQRGVFQTHRPGEAGWIFLKSLDIRVWTEG